MQMRAQGFDSEKRYNDRWGGEGADTLTIRTMQIDKKEDKPGN